VAIQKNTRREHLRLNTAMTDEKRDKMPFLCRTLNHYSSVIQPMS